MDAKTLKQQALKALKILKVGSEEEQRLARFFYKRSDGCVCAVGSLVPMLQLMDAGHMSRGIVDIYHDYGDVRAAIKASGFYVQFLQKLQRVNDTAPFICDDYARYKHVISWLEKVAEEGEPQS